MDPNATLAELIEAATATDGRSDYTGPMRAELVRDLATDLADWIARGGFLPSDPRGSV